LVIVMNVVHVEKERQEEFERHFLGRDSRLTEAEGFAGFDLLRRDRDGEYVVLTRWESNEAFQAWLKSDLFKEAHRHTEGGNSAASDSEVRMYEVIDTQVPA
jgi:heme-degrading monooxygenase HmoA